MNILISFLILICPTSWAQPAQDEEWKIKFSFLALSEEEKKQLNEFLERLKAIPEMPATPLHRIIFGGNISGKVYESWLQNHGHTYYSARHYNDPNPPEVVTSFPTGNDDMTRVIKRRNLGDENVNTTGFVFFGPRFFEPVKDDPKFDFAYKVSRLMGASQQSQQPSDRQSCSKLGRSVLGGLVAPLAENDCESRVDGARGISCVVMYNMALALNENWDMDKFPGCRRLVDQARKEVTEDLKGTRYESKWK